MLRRPDRVVPALTWALARYDDAHARDKALYLTWLAEAHIDADQIPKAARTLGDAISLGGDVASCRPRKRVSEVVERLRPHTSTPAVAEVIDRANSMRCASSSAYRSPVVRRNTCHSSPVPSSPRCQNADPAGPNT